MPLSSILLTHHVTHETMATNLFDSGLRTTKDPHKVMLAGLPECGGGVCGDTYNAEEVDAK